VSQAQQKLWKFYSVRTSSTFHQRNNLW